MCLGYCGQSSALAAVQGCHGEGQNVSIVAWDLVISQRVVAEGWAQSAAQWNTAD